MEWSAAQLEAFATLVVAPQHLPNVLRVVQAFQDDTWYAWTAGWLREQGHGPVLDARPRIAAHPLGWYAQKPPGSLGRAYHDHLAQAGIDPDALRIPDFGTERGWLRARTYETHDIGHALTGFGTTGYGEAGLLAFIASQCPARHSLALLAGIFGAAANGGTIRHDVMLEAVTRGHLLARGSVPMLVVDWDTLWDVPLDEVRARLDVRMERLAALA